MRIAVVFAGQIRSFQSCYPSIYRYLIQPLESVNENNGVDIFMHLWEFGKSCSDFKGGKFLTEFKLQNDECTLEYVIDKSQPTRIVCDRWTLDWEQKIMNETGGNTIIENMNQRDMNYAVSALCMYYKIQKAMQLKADYEKENGFKYDLVIRARLDFRWNEYIPIHELMPVKHDDIIIVADNYARHGCNDKFFSGTSEMMDRFCSIPERALEIWKSGNYRDFEGQEIHKWMIKDMKLNIRKFGSNDTYCKYLGSSRIKEKQKHYLINNCLTGMGMELCEKFLEMGIMVTGITGKVNSETNKVSDKNKKRTLDFLAKYKNFIYREEDIEEDETKYSRVIYLFNSDNYTEKRSKYSETVYIGFHNKFSDKQRMKLKLFIDKRSVCIPPVNLERDGPNKQIRIPGNQIADWIFHQVYNKNSGSKNIEDNVVIEPADLTKYIRKCIGWWSVQPE